MKKLIYTALIIVIFSACGREPPNKTSSKSIYRPDQILIQDYGDWVSDSPRCSISTMYLTFERGFQRSESRYTCDNRYFIGGKSIESQNVIVRIDLISDTEATLQHELYSRHLIYYHGDYNEKIINRNNVLVKGDKLFGWTHLNMAITVITYLGTTEENAMLLKYLEKYPSDLTFKKPEDVYLSDRNIKIDQIMTLNSELPYLNYLKKQYMIREMCYYEEILRRYGNYHDLSCQISGLLDDKERTLALEKFKMDIVNIPIDVDMLEGKTIYITSLSPQSERLMMGISRKYYFIQVYFIEKVFPKMRALIW